MLATYPHTCTHKHICGTVADTLTCIHNALHQLGSIAPFREHCTSSEGVSYSRSGVTPQRNKNFRGHAIRNSHQTGVLHDTSLRHASDARSQDLM